MKFLFKILIYSLLVALVVIPSELMAQTCPKDRPDYFCLSVEMAPDSNVQIFDFYNVPVKILSLFSDEISKLRYPVTLDAKWESPYFGAGVSLYDNQYRLMILGGMTRIEKMTVDAYAAIVCHEIGHIIGGAPFQTINGAEWSSAEGQSDYFAASVCLPRYFKSVSEKNISKRIEQAGFEMMNALKDFDSNEPDAKLERFFEFKNTVDSTLINNYPSIQCRYETFRNPSKRASCWYK